MRGKILLILLLSTLASGQYDYGRTDVMDMITFYAVPVICGLYFAFRYIAGGLASLMIIYAGIKYLSSADDPGARKNAKDTIIHAMIAIIIILVGSGIVEYLGFSDSC